MILKPVWTSLKTNKYVCLLIKRRFPKIFLRKILLIGFIINSTVLIVFVFNNYFNDNKNYSNMVNRHEIFEMTSLKGHKLIVEQYYEMRKHWKTSNLGSLIFKYENDLTRYQSRNKTFVILVWKYWKWLRERHVNFYGPRKTVQTVLKDCSVQNCIFTGDDSVFDSVDAVLIHVMHGDYPRVKKRDNQQLWIFLNDESPCYAFTKAKTQPTLRSWANVFNWSMSYRTNSDVPVPYGRTVPLKKPVKENVSYDSIAELIPNLQFKRSDVLVSVIMTNCKPNKRMKFLEELQKHIQIDVYGRCSKDNRTWCPGHFKADCHLVDQYYFYLVMENSMCRQYITEKVFHHGYSKGAIPIIVGPSLHDCKTLLPPNSYIHSDDYLSQKELAEKIKSVIQNTKEFFSYHLWRNHFQVLNEHGYYGSKSLHLCRLCQALNYNEEKTKIYKLDDLRIFLDYKTVCMMFE